MPPGLNRNGRTLPGRHGVATSPPGSQVFAHMCSLNNTTLPVWVYCLLAWWRAVAGTRWRHRQHARWGSLLPLMSCLMDEGFWEEEAGRRWWAWKEPSIRNKIDAHSVEYFWSFSDAIRQTEFVTYRAWNWVLSIMSRNKSTIPNPILSFLHITWIVSLYAKVNINLPPQVVCWSTAPTCTTAPQMVRVTVNTSNSSNPLIFNRKEMFARAHTARSEFKQKKTSPW